MEDEEFYSVWKMGKHILERLKAIALEECSDDSEVVQTVSDLFPKNRKNIIGLYMERCGLDKRQATIAYEDLSGRHAARMTRIYTTCSHPTISRRSRKRGKMRRR